MSRSNIPNEVVKIGETLYYIKDNEVCSDVVTFAGKVPAVGGWFNPNDYGWDIKKSGFTLVVPLNDGFATYQEAKEELKKRLGITYKYKVGDVVYINGYAEATDSLCKIEKCKVVNLPDDDVDYRSEGHVGMYLLESYNWENRKWDTNNLYGAYESEMSLTYKELLTKLEEDIVNKEKAEVEAEELANRPAPKFKEGDVVLVVGRQLGVSLEISLEKAKIKKCEWFCGGWTYRVEYLNNVNWHDTVAECICINVKDVVNMINRG